jgi:hypothetical protein
LDLVDKVRPYLVLIGGPLAITLPLTIVLWLIAGQPIPEALLLPIAILLTPPLWLGVIFVFVLSRYTTVAQRMGKGRSPDLSTCRLALRRLDQAYRTREWLARSHLRASVYVGYLLKYLQLRTTITSHPLNPYRGNEEELAEDRRRRQQQMMFQISQFVFLSGTASKGQSSADDALLEVLTLLPPGPSKRVIEDIVLNAYNDGPGFLSTLTATMYLHFMVALPPARLSDVQSSLVGLKFDANRYGWLGNRVLESVIYLCIREGVPAAGVIARLQPLLDQITDEITGATASDIGEVKWRGRNKLRTAAGLTW